MAKLCETLAVVILLMRPGKMGKSHCPGSIGHFALGGKQEGYQSNTDQHRENKKYMVTFSVYGGARVKSGFVMGSSRHL